MRFNELSEEEKSVIVDKGTEAPHSGEYDRFDAEGVFVCRRCGAYLYRSEDKFDAHCGWPAFYTPLAQDRVELLEDRSHFSVRTEVRCATCGSHLGHVFSGEGFPTPTNDRYCINGVSLTLEPADG